MTEQIGQMWEEGERLAGQGELHEGLLRFMRAKTMLLAMGGEAAGGGERGGAHKQSSIPRILRQIMVKLNDSIEKNISVLQENPLQALQCVTPSFTPKDIKKAYRTMILKYHPDKNPDCDTSCIFTTIQAAYERLINAPLASSPRNYATDTGKESDGFHSAFYKASKPSSSSSSKNQRRHRTQTSNEKTNGGKQSDGNVYGLSSEQIRQTLRVLATTGGVGRRRQQQVEKELASCSREELVRRYLNARARALSTGQSETQWHKKIEALLRQERKQREKEQRQEKTNRHTPDIPSPSTDDAGENIQSKKEKADMADIHRKERVDRMRKELPLMSVPELRRMMITCCIPLVGCVEKTDLLQALCKYYGIPLASISLEATESYNHNGNTSSTKKSNNNKKAHHAGFSNMNMTADSLRKVMKSSGYEGFGGNASPRSGHVSSNSTESTYTKTNVGEVRASAKVNVSDNKNVWTREKLKDLERKLNGDRQARRDAVAAQKKKKELLEQQTNVETGTMQAQEVRKDKFAATSNMTQGKQHGILGMKDNENDAFPENIRLGVGNDDSSDSDIEGEEAEESDEIVSPRGRFLDVEDSDIDDCSNSPGSSSDDEILWRKFIHHPIAPHGSQEKQNKMKTAKRTSVDEDMNVEIPSLDDLMKSLGDFDFNVGALDNKRVFIGSKESISKNDKSPLSGKRSVNTPPLSPTKATKFPDDSKVSPQEKTSKRCYGNLKSVSAKSVTYPDKFSSPRRSVQLGVSLLNEASDSDDSSDNKSYISEVKKSVRENNMSNKLSSPSTAGDMCNDNYWRDMIMHGKDGYKDSLDNITMNNHEVLSERMSATSGLNFVEEVFAEEQPHRLHSTFLKRPE